VLGLGLIAVIVLWAPWRSEPRRARRASALMSGQTFRSSMVMGSNAILSQTAPCWRSWRRRARTTAAQIYVRRLEQLQATALAGTEVRPNPFFAPDGQSIAFFGGGKLKKGVRQRRRPRSRCATRPAHAADGGGRRDDRLRTAVEFRNQSSAGVVGRRHADSG
jgi:hypothetical protein